MLDYKLSTVAPVFIYTKSERKRQSGNKAVYRTPPPPHSLICKVNHSWVRALYSQALFMLTANTQQLGPGAGTRQGINYGGHPCCVALWCVKWMSIYCITLWESENKHSCIEFHYKRITRNLKTSADFARCTPQAKWRQHLIRTQNIILHRRHWQELCKLLSGLQVRL